MSTITSLLTSLKEKYPDDSFVDQIIALHEADEYSVVPDPSYRLEHLEKKLQHIGKLVASTEDMEHLFRKAINTDNLEFLRFMVEDMHVSIKRYDDYVCPLHAAIAHNNLDIVKFLVENGSSAYNTGYEHSGLSKPYIYATNLACKGSCSVDIPLYLLDALFRKPVSSIDLDSVICIASRHSNEKIIEHIIVNHPDINHLFREVTNLYANPKSILRAFDKYRPGWRNEVRGVTYVSVALPSSMPPLHSTANFNNLSRYTPH